MSNAQSTGRMRLVAGAQPLVPIVTEAGITVPGDVAVAVSAVRPRRLLLLAGLFLLAATIGGALTQYLAIGQ